MLLHLISHKEYNCLLDQQSSGTWQYCYRLKKDCGQVLLNLISHKEYNCLLDQQSSGTWHQIDTVNSHYTDQTNLIFIIQAKFILSEGLIQRGGDQFIYFVV